MKTLTSTTPPSSITTADARSANDQKTECAKRLPKSRKRSVRNVPDRSEGLSLRQGRLKPAVQSPRARKKLTDRRLQNDPSTIVVVRTEKRSWLAIAITGFGALLLRYLRVVRERNRQLRKSR